MRAESGHKSKWFALGTLGAIAAVFLLTLRSSAPTAVRAPQADQIIVEKSRHTMSLLNQGRVIRTYRVALGRGGSGPKQEAGDNKVPEGQYRIAGRNPHSSFYRALKVGYPTPRQALIARQHGVDPGGEIMIHGIRNGLGWVGPLQRAVDWTKGCIAVTDPEMDEIWNLVPDGTKIEILP
jgi:murein L,D-transpeptidase YafK